MFNKENLTEVLLSSNASPKITKTGDAVYRKSVFYKVIISVLVYYLLSTFAPSGIMHVSPNWLVSIIEKNPEKFLVPTFPVYDPMTYLAKSLGDLFSLGTSLVLAASPSRGSYDSKYRAAYFTGLVFVFVGCSYFAWPVVFAALIIT